MPLATVVWAPSNDHISPGGEGTARSRGGCWACFVALPAGSQHWLPASYLCDLHTPVEQVLGADVVLVLADVVQQAAEGHELCDELHGGGQADAQEAAHMGVVHTGHHVGLLQEKRRRHVSAAPRRGYGTKQADPS